MEKIKKYIIKFKDSKNIIYESYDFTSCKREWLLIKYIFEYTGLQFIVQDINETVLYEM